MADARINNIFEHVDASKAARAKQYRDEAERRAKEQEEMRKKEEASSSDELPFLKEIEATQLSQIFAPEEPESKANKPATTPAAETPKPNDSEAPSHIEIRDLPAKPPAAERKEQVPSVEKKPEPTKPAETERVVPSKTDKGIKTGMVLKMDAPVPSQHTCSVYLVHRYNEATGAFAFALTMAGETYYESQSGHSDDPCEFMLRAGISLLTKVLEKDAWSFTVYTQTKETAVMLDKMARKLYPGPAIEVRRKYVSIAQEAVKQCGLVFMSMPQDTTFSKYVASSLDSMLNCT